MNRKLINLTSSVLSVTIFATANIANADDTKNASPATSADSAAALTVKVDPETGELVPMTSEEAAAMAAAQQRSTKGLATSKNADVVGKVIYHANGVRSMVLDPSMLQSITAETAPDGTLKIRHGDHDITQPATDAPEK